jgi:hypothetical protein
MRNWWLKNKDKKREYDRKYRKNHPELQIKKAEYHHKRRRHYSQLQRLWHQRNPDWTRLRNQEVRRKILLRLGNKCSNPNCLVLNGCSDPRCLQIDHINGKGTYERRILGMYRFYAKLLKLDDVTLKRDYQLLCANCNWIKKYERNENTTIGRKLKKR